MTDIIEGLTEGLGEKEARLFEYCEQQPEIKKYSKNFKSPGKTLRNCITN